MIKAHISKQPIKIDKFTNRYQMTCMLQKNDFPDNFQCLNIPVSFKLTLNDFINYFIPKKMLLARKKWIQEELRNTHISRKKKEYASMIEQKYGITPLDFSRRITRISNEILEYIRQNYDNVIDIVNEVGILNLEIPHCYYLSNNTGISVIELRFHTNFDTLNCGVKSNLIFNFKWMKKIFRDYFK